MSQRTKSLDIHRVPCIVRFVLTVQLTVPQFSFRATLLSSCQQLLRKKLAQRLQDQTRRSACSHMSGWATVGGSDLSFSAFFMRKNQKSAKEPYSLATFHLSPVVRVSRTSAESRKSRTESSSNSPTRETCSRSTLCQCRPLSRGAT